VSLLAAQGFFAEDETPKNLTQLPSKPFEYSVTDIEDTSAGAGQTWRVSVDCFSEAPPTRDELEQAASRIYQRFGDRGRWLSPGQARQNPSVWIEFSLSYRRSAIPYAVAQIHTDERENQIIINR
jgi:hypothetical protein